MPVTNGQTNVLSQRGVPIPGLYAAGNEMNSIMDGTYPGPGITLGPGITFDTSRRAISLAGSTTPQQTCPALEKTMYYELRTYTLKPTKLAMSLRIRTQTAPETVPAASL